MILQTSVGFDKINLPAVVHNCANFPSGVWFGKRTEDNGTKSNLGSSQGEKCIFSTVMILADNFNLQTQCRIFSLNFNPQRLRLGNKVLRQRLRGPTLAAWYPTEDVSFRDLQTKYKRLGLTTFDEAEDDRQEAIQM